MEYGCCWIWKISLILVKSGFIIVLGLVVGIDIEVYSVCLEVGGRIVVVFGNGVDIVYFR